MAKVYKQHGEGWNFFVDPLIAACTANGVKIRQIKEKFGTLRFYTDPHDIEWLHDLVQAAESISAYVCERSGDVGRLRNINRYFQTLSDEEYEALTND